MAFHISRQFFFGSFKPVPLRFGKLRAGGIDIEGSMDIAGLDGEVPIRLLQEALLSDLQERNMLSLTASFILRAPLVNWV